MTENIELQAIRRENKGLKEENSNLLKSNKLQQHKMEEQIAISQSEHEELIRLRETIFNMTHNKKTEELEAEEAGTSISIFPYISTKRVCVYGGRNSWMASMKQLLPNLSFYNCDTPLSSDTVRNADEIWIQTNYISHSYFYGLIDVAKTNNVPIKYFSHAGAKQCAEQFVQSI
jgi:hypothetical protein